MVPRKAPVVGFGGAMAGLPVWVAKMRLIEKQRDGRDLGLRWPPINTNNQESTDSWEEVVAEMIGWRRVSGIACGGIPSHCLKQLLKQ